MIVKVVVVQHGGCGVAGPPASGASRAMWTSIERDKRLNPYVDQIASTGESVN